VAESSELSQGHGSDAENGWVFVHQFVWFEIVLTCGGGVV